MNLFLLLLESYVQMTKGNYFLFHHVLEVWVSQYFSDECDLEYNNSRNITASLRKSIVEQSTQYSAERKNFNKKIKSNQIVRKRQKDILESIRSSMNEKTIADLTITNTEKGVSNWLTVLPIKHHGFDLNKQEFWDGIRLRYGWNLFKFCQQFVPAATKF